MERLCELHAAGVSIWLDTLSRHLIASGEFGSLVDDACVTGATSNPTIFAAAIRGVDGYEQQLQALLRAEARNAQEIFFDLALDDVRNAADILRPVYDQSDGRDGFVSFECTPDLADDTDATIEQARMLWERLDRRNVMIKVPATAAGLGAIEELTAAGVNVNVTLLFARERYDEVIEAYLSGLQRRAAAGDSVDTVSSAASFFVSRVDAKADEQLAQASPLRGRVAIANAKLAYQLYQHRFSNDRWNALAVKGARPQRPLWASTGTKNPAYPDVMYVDELIGPDVVNTMPDKTLRAFADHGHVHRTVDTGFDDAEQVLADLQAAGVELDLITSALEREGVSSFCDSYHQLLDCITEKAAGLGVRLDSSPEVPEPPQT
jgi:transaldolase